MTENRSRTRRYRQPRLRAADSGELQFPIVRGEVSELHRWAKAEIMATGENMSSAWTGIHKYVFPAPLVVMSVLLVISALTDVRSLWLLIPIGVINAFVLWFSVPLKWLHIDKSEFVISDGVCESRAPISSLRRVRPFRWWRVPTIYLYFDPPTRFGGRIAIIPPVDFASNHFDRIAGILTKAIKDTERKTAQPGATDNPGDAQ